MSKSVNHNETLSGSQVPGPGEAAWANGGAIDGKDAVAELIGDDNCFAVMRSSSEEGLYVRLVAFLYHSTLGRE